MLDFSNYSVDSKYYDDSNRLVVGKWNIKQVVLLKQGVSLLKNLLDYIQRCINSW